MTTPRQAALVLLSWLCLCLPALAESYRLGPEDRIGIRAVAWDEERRAYARWDVLEGEYAVQSDGTMALPLAGPVAAAGLTLGELSDKIAAALRDRGGMRRPPDLALSMTAYRPFYVTGDVARPGAYDGRPGLTALQAVALAGGAAEVSRATERNEDAVLRDGARLVRALGDLARAQARLDRLNAEAAEAESVSFDPAVRHPDGPERMEAIRADERLVFDVRRQAMALQMETLEDLGLLLTAEIENLERKLAGQNEQIRLAQEMLDNVSGLAQQGLARGTRLAEAQTRLLDLQGEETDLLNGIYRARQRITENARDLVELRTRRRTEVAQEIQRVTERIEQLEVDRGLFERLLLAHGGVSAAGLGLEVETIYSVLRDGASADEAQIVSATAPVGPGDVLIVRMLVASEGPATQ